MDEKHTIKRKEGSPSIKSILASFAAVGTVLVGLLTVAAGLFTTNNTLVINSLKETLTAQIAKENALNNAVVNIREFILIEQQECINERYSGDIKKLRKDTIKIIFPLLRETMTSDEVFDALLGKKVQGFISLIYENKNICAKNFPSDGALKKLIREINLYMRKFTSKINSEILEHESRFFGLL